MNYETMDSDALIKEIRKLKARVKELENIIDVLNETDEDRERLKIRVEQINDVQEQLTGRCEQYDLRLKKTEQEYLQKFAELNEKEIDYNNRGARLADLSQEADRRAKKIYVKKDKKLRHMLIYMSIGCGILFILLIIAIIL